MSKDKKEIVVEEKVSFPSETLAWCLDSVSQVVKSRGDTFVKIDDIAMILDRQAGALSLPVSTCIQYGLLQNVFKKGYRATELFHKIDKPVYESDKIKSIFEALSNPVLYKKLIDGFNNKVLPDEQGMANYLVKNFGVKPYLVQKVIRVFFDNFRDNGIIDSNNKFKYLVPLSVPKHEDSNISNGNDNVVSDPLPPQPVNEKMFELPIDLTGVKMAYLKYPKGDMSIEDIEMMEMMINAAIRALRARLGVRSNELFKE